MVMKSEPSITSFEGGNSLEAVKRLKSSLFLRLNLLAAADLRAVPRSLDEALTLRSVSMTLMRSKGLFLDGCVGCCLDCWLLSV